MFVKSDIDRLLREGQLRILYSFLPDGEAFKYVGERQVCPDEQDNPATLLFDKYYFGDRLKLTLGPVVKSHTVPRDPKRTPFKQFPSCYDLRAMGGRIKLAPREVISVQTNERITLGANLAAVILPRLTTADSGLLYIPSYIDPYWDGLLQGVIINLTNDSQSLRLGEGVAICRFYKLSDGAPAELVSAFPAKSHHYGNNWPRILDEDADPFPVQKRPLTEERLALPDRVRRFLNHHKKTLKQFGVIGGLVGIVFYAGKVSMQLEDLVNLSRRVDHVEKSIEEMGARAPLTGLISVAIPQLEVATTTRIPLSQRLRVGATIWASPVGRQRGILSISSRVENESGNGTSTLVLDVSVSPENVDRVIPLQWMVVE